MPQKDIIIYNILYYKWILLPLKHYVLCLFLQHFNRIILILILQLRNVKYIQIFLSKYFILMNYYYKILIPLKA